MIGQEAQTGSGGGKLAYRLVTTLAGKGTGPDRFERALRAVAVDARMGVIAVGDAAVKVFDPAGALRASWSTEQDAHSVAVDAEGRVLVGELDQVEVFDGTGSRESVLRDPPRLGRVTALAPFEGGILLADASARCLRRYTGDGKHLADIGHDNRMKGFLIPNGVLDFAVDDQGVIHASNPGKHRVERYSAAGELLGHFGRFDGRDPAGFAGCCNPTNLTVAAGGRVFVTEKAGPRAKVYDAQGRLLAVIASEVFDPGCKNMDLAVDTDGRVYVADTARLAIRVFEPEPTGDNDER